MADNPIYDAATMKRILLVPSWLWNHVVRYVLETQMVLTAVYLGMQLLIFQPLSSGVPSVRGLRLLDEIMGFLPWKSDYTWAALLLIPSLTQLVLLFQRRNPHARALASFAIACVFSFITVLLFQDNFRTTGVPMYSMVTIGNMIVFVQLTQERFGLHDL